VELTSASGSILEQRAESYVVPLAEGSRRLSGATAEVDARAGGAIARLLRDGLVRGSLGEIAVLPALGRMRGKRIVIVGTGRAEQASADRLRTLAGTLIRRLRDLDAGRVALAAQAPLAAVGSAGGSGDGVEAAAEALAEGLVLGGYRFDRHHTREEDRPKGVVRSVAVVTASARQAQAVGRGLERGRILAEATNEARDLENAPANLMTPTDIASHALELADDVGLECTVIERAEAERLGMGSYLSVAAGSVQPPKFIVLRYRGAGRARPLALVGKGITFDSGGISLKPGAGMEAMKADMSGAASVIAAMRAIGRLQPRVNVLAIAPCTENMPGGSATKPGDVVYAMDGQSIEVINTDAEGRLVLADGIAYARQERASAIVDVATLTGAMSVALGNVRAGVFASNDRLYAELERAAGATGERLWRFPLDDEYARAIRSDVADVKNVGGRAAGSITAAKFLQRFVGDTPWAHIDIAGVMSIDRDRGEWVKGSSGIPARTLVRLALGRSRG
jgi:leucyl aminopeptidase